MKIQELYNIDHAVKVNDWKEVKSQVIYSSVSANTFSDQGLYSEEIFGQTPMERTYRCGYIKLPIHVFNPSVAASIMKLSGGIIRKMAYGEIKCNLVDGQLVIDPNGKYSGFQDLYNIWDKIDLKKTFTSKVKEKMDILVKSPRNLIFNDKVLVLPPEFRPIGMKNGKQVKSELNTLYMQLLGQKSVAMHTGKHSYNIHNNIQEIIINIYNYIKKTVGGKNGFFQQKLLSKTTAWSAGNVISAPRYNTDTPEIGVFRTGIPLHTMCSLFNPLIKYQLKQILSADGIASFHPNPNEVNAADIQNIYDDKKIKDMIKIYQKNPGHRFQPLYLDAENTKPIMFEAFDTKNNQAISRPFTICDAIYLATYSVVVKANRSVYIVRYPIGDYLGAFFTKAHVLSTNYTSSIQFQGEIYSSYPVIDPSLSHNIISTSFSDTVTPSNSRLDAIGGDYDGDTVKMIGIWSDEANAKAEELMYSKIYNITPQGTTVYGIAIECLNGLYGLTKNDEVGREPKSQSNPKIAVERIATTPVENINKSFIEEMFASYHDRTSGKFHQANFTPSDEITLTPNDYPKLKSNVKTTLGRFLMNRYILEKNGLSEHMGYWNEPLNKKNLGQLSTTVNSLVIADIIDTKRLGEYVDARDRLGFWCASFLSVSISPKLVLPMNDVKKRKKELFKEHQAMLNSDNPVDQVMTANMIEKELVQMAHNNLKQDPGYDFFASGDGNLDNNYKTINIMRGSVYNNTTKKYDVIENSLMDGVTQKDIPAFSNSITMGAYPSAIGTADAGYTSKKILALLQSEHINPDPNSDCGTKSTIPITVTRSNKQYMLFRNVQHRGRKVMITPDNVEKIIGQTVQMYTPMGCLQDAICGKCAGKVFHNLGVTRVGLLITQITMKMLNLKLKSKHDLSQNASIIPEEYMFADQNKYCTIENKVMKNNVHMKMFIPRLLEDLNSFVRETTSITCMGLFPVKFYDNHDNELMSTLMTVPAMLEFNIYSDIGEDAEHYIVTYEPGSNICRMDIQQSIANVEAFINQVYLESKIPQIPYNLITEMMWRCLDINGIDLTGPSITYELLGRRMCRSGIHTFAKAYGKDEMVDPMSYTKIPFRQAVQESGVLQGMLFEDLSASLNKGLYMSLNNIPPTPTPLENIIKS